MNNHDKNTNHRNLILLFLILFVIVGAFYYYKAKEYLPKKEALKQDSKSKLEYVDERHFLPSFDTALLMSVDELRTFPDFENISEAEGKNYIYSMQEYCMITYELYKQEKNNSDEKQS